MNSFRLSILKHLILLSSATKQLAHEASVPSAPVPVELVCIWFDDLYDPSAALFDELSKHEVEALAIFHKVFDAEQSAYQAPTVSQLVALPAWERVRDAAAIACVAFQPQ